MTTVQNFKYVHGYSERETERLYDQAGSVRDLIHSDIAYPPSSVVLEVGCGVGAQTLTLAQNSPKTKFLSVDWVENSLALARELIERNKISNVEFLHADILFRSINSRAKAREFSTQSTERNFVFGLFCARVSVCAPTPQPTSRTTELGGYAISEWIKSLTDPA
jgi:16S rRNA A1518/A1519 N6-dimethyltransferase RsmA/KsgA/DIM1 with predicted DNA glycosylase/AP lyase activity